MLESLSFGFSWRYAYLVVQYAYLFFKTILCAVHNLVLSCFTFFFVSLFSFQGTPGGGQFALRFVLIVLGVRGVFPTALLALPLAFVSAAGTFFALASVASRAAPAVVGSNGLEPSTSRLSGVRSNHLSYEPISVAGSFQSAKPLVETNRIELSTPCLQGRCSPS